MLAAQCSAPRPPSALPLIAHCSLLSAHRSPLTAHRSPLSAQCPSRPSSSLLVSLFSVPSAAGSRALCSPLCALLRALPQHSRSLLIAHCSVPPAHLLPLPAHLFVLSALLRAHRSALPLIAHRS